VTGRYTSLTDKFIERCDFGIRGIKNPVDFQPKNLHADINTEFNEYLPALTADEKTLIFTRLIPTGKRLYDGSLEMQEDFFVSKKINAKFQKAKALGAPLNTYSNEGAQSISADGKILIFTSCDDEFKKNPHGRSYGSCDLYISTKTDDTWSKPRNLGAPVNTAYWESQPSFSADGRSLYFTSNRPSGKGGMDIWKTEMKADSSWTKPVNLGAVINTKSHEQSPFIHYDNQTLYFSSNGHIGMGNMDLFLSKLDSSGIWTEPKNMGYPINTHDDEVSLIVNPKGNRAYYASSKKSEFGGLDLYTFELNRENRPNQVTYVKGTVFDISTNEELEALINLIDINQNKAIAQTISDKKNGEYLLCIPSGHDYAFNVSKPGYLFYSESFTLAKTEDSLKIFHVDIPLSPIKKGQRTILKNIFFAYDSYELQSTSFAELDKMYEFLSQNPDIKIEIGGHTDNTGSDSHNDQLSLNRAKAVYDNLILRGINEDRLSFKGYGSKQPIDTNQSPEGRQNNRRTEFKVL
jgi:outer membrane protein OmpA-like peptidoglycan-associated protein